MITFTSPSSRKAVNEWWKYVMPIVIKLTITKMLYEFYIWKKLQNCNMYVNFCDIKNYIVIKVCDWCNVMTISHTYNVISVQVSQSQPTLVDLSLSQSSATDFVMFNRSIWLIVLRVCSILFSLPSVNILFIRWFPCPFQPWAITTVIFEESQLEFLTEAWLPKYRYCAVAGFALKCNNV